MVNQNYRLDYHHFPRALPSGLRQLSAIIPHIWFDVCIMCKNYLNDTNQFLWRH